MIEPHEWNSIVELIEQQIPTREVIFAKVLKRDVIKKLVWVAEFDQTGIPLADFDRGFSYYENEPFGVTTAVGTNVNVRSKKWTDTTPNDVKNPNFLTVLQVPQIDDIVVILKPGGILRFPVCIGKIQSVGHWEEDESGI